MGFLLSLRWKKSYKTVFRYSLEGEGSGFHTCLFVPKFFEPLPKNILEYSKFKIQKEPCKYIVIIALSRFESMERCRDNLTTMAQWWDVGDGIVGWKETALTPWRDRNDPIVGWHDGNKAMLYRVFARALLHHSHRVFAPSRYRLLLADVLLEIRMAASLQSTWFSSWDLRSNIYRVYLSNNAACWQH